MPALKNQRHELYAQALASGKSAAEAYRAAGYMANRGNASVLKAKQSISGRVSEILTAAAKRVEINAAWVLSRLVENVERAMQATPVLDGDGCETGAWKYDGAVANKALELLGRHYGCSFGQKIEHGGPGGGPIPLATPLDMSKLTIAEVHALRALADKASK